MATTELHVIVLAAGSREYRAEQQRRDAWLLQPVGDRAMIDYVLDLARTVATEARIIVVTAGADSELARHLGATVRTVAQADARVELVMPCYRRNPRWTL